MAWRKKNVQVVVLGRKKTKRLDLVGGPAGHGGLGGGNAAFSLCVAASGSVGPTAPWVDLAAVSDRKTHNACSDYACVSGLCSPVGDCRLRPAWKEREAGAGLLKSRPRGQGNCFFRRRVRRKSMQIDACPCVCVLFGRFCGCAVCLARPPLPPRVGVGFSGEGCDGGG